MSSFITDQHVMDPDVLVSLWSTRKPWTLGLWSGLSRSLSIGVCLATGLAVGQWGVSASLIALWFPPIIILLIEHFVNCPKTGFGAWMNVLQNSVSFSLAASGLSTTLDRMADGRGRHWLDEHIGKLSPDILALGIVFGITFLFVLGLERSTLLRAILIMSVSSCIIFFITTGLLKIDNTLWKQLQQTPKNLTQILHAIAFLTCAYAGVSPYSKGILKHSSFPALCFSAFSYTTVVVFLALVVEQRHTNSVMYLLKVFEIRNVWWGREAMAILIILSLSLSLPELLSSGQNSLNTISGHILPSVLSKENHTTGTQIYYILFIGVLSCILVTLCSIQKLLCLSSASYILIQVADIISAIHLLYQPTLLPNIINAGFINNNKKYKLLPHKTLSTVDQTALIDTSEDEEPLSDDSGHSSDTDIDAIVAEYKERIKVVTTLTDPITLEPTLATSQRVDLALVAIIVFATAQGFALINAYYWVAFGSLLRAGLWSFTQQFFNFKGKFKRRKERIKLRLPPNHKTVTSYLPSYRRMTHVDTVLITR
uniref:Amino acid permease/ SLC12A domain-containing protein n=1 Tax=Clastoptera arizonana TaxID=38151 RepID=A0A1B6D7J5_9HEMI